MELLEESQTVIRPRDEHRLSRKLIDPDALKVLYRLKTAGYIAYLVGGSVRDLLLGVEPKDFDIGTDARPNQIKRLFRNCFLVGRRFRLAHVRFGEKVIETSTFRSLPQFGPDVDPADPEAELLMHRDNTFGTPEEDARRRDFTINGLFYDIRTFAVIDHVGGLADLDARLLRSIGDPHIRFREDPVRMLRAVRLAARIGLTIEDETFAAIGQHAREIEKASPPRLLEEIHRLFAMRNGEAAFRLLHRSGLMSVLFPEVDAYLNASGDAPELWRLLAALDAESATGEPTPALMFASLLYPAFTRLLAQTENTGRAVKVQEMTRRFLEPLAARLSLPKKTYQRLLLMFYWQRRFEPGARRFSKERFMACEAFPETLAFFGLRAKAGLADDAAFRTWAEEFSSFLDSGGGYVVPDRSDRRRGRRSRGGARRSGRSSGAQVAARTERTPAVPVPEADVPDSPDGFDGAGGQSARRSGRGRSGSSRRRRRKRSA